MSRLKLFLENFFIYGLGGVIGKIIPLIMLPVVTRLMPDSTYFGISDMSNTLISFAGAVALMGMYDAMYRLFFDREDEEYRKQVCSTAMFFTMFCSVAVFLFMILGKRFLAVWFFKDASYSGMVCISAVATLVSATNSIVAAPTRMQNRRRVYLLTNAVAPLLSYSVSIPLLLSGHYVIALPVAAVISGIMMEIVFVILNRRWFRIKWFRKDLLKPLLVIAVPVMPVFLVYWIFNSCDRLMIKDLIGMSAVGSYSVSAKLGHASQLIYTAFAGGWQYFAFSTMREADQVKTNSGIFEYLGIISFSAAMFVCAFSFPLFGFLFPDQYREGYIAAPYLFLAPLLLMLYQVIGNQFLVIKKTWYSLFLLAGGAVANVIMNRILIRLMGIEGAAVATLLGYVLTVIASAVVLVRMKLLIVSKRFLVSAGIMLIYLVLWRKFFAENTVAGCTAAVCGTAFYAVLYHRDIRVVTEGITKIAGKGK